MPIYTLLARRRDNRPAQLTMRRQTPRIAHQMDARQGHECGQLLQEFQRRECDASGAVRPRLGERVHEVPMGIFRKTLQRHGASCRVPNQAFQLVSAMRWYLRVGVQRKPMDTGTARTRKCGEFPFIPKPSACCDVIRPSRSH
jgi:hypothetical protein